MVSPRDTFDKSQMGKDWDERAKRDALYYTHNDTDSEGTWDVNEYFKTGQKVFETYLLPYIQHHLPDSKEEDVLEIGVGVGRIGRWVAPHFRSYTGLDVSEQMLKRAYETFRHYNIKHTLVHGTGYSLQGTPNELGFIYSIIVFQHIPDVRIQIAYIMDIMKKLKRGGHFYLHLYNAVEEYDHIKAKWEERRQAKDVMGWQDIAVHELDRYETWICTPVDAERVMNVIHAHDIEVTLDTGRNTPQWLIAGRKP